MFLGLKAKWLIGSGIALVLILSVVFGVRYIQGAEESKITTEIQEKQIERRKKIDEAVRNSPDTVDDSLQYLRDR